MSGVLPDPLLGLPAASGRITPGLGGAVSYGVFRLPTDPLYYATLTLRNVVAGSRYRVTRTDTGGQLATGVAGGSGMVDVVLAGLACYANPQSMTVVIRTASAAPFYKTFTTIALVPKAGTEAYILQQLDQ